MSTRRLLLAVPLATLAVWFVDGAVAMHGGGVKDGIWWPYGSSLNCVLGVAEATLKFKDDAIKLKSAPGKSSTCNVFSDVGKPEPAEFKLNIKATNIKRACTSVSGANASIASFTQRCGSGADTTGKVAEAREGRVLPKGRDLPIGGMTDLTERQCNKVFPRDMSGSEPLPKRVTLVAKMFYTKSKDCTGRGVHGPITLRMCYGDLAATPGSEPACVDAHGKPKKSGRGDLQQYDLVGLACQNKPVGQNCEAKPSGVVEATIDGRDIDVRSIDTDSLACGDPSGAPAIKFDFGYFLGKKNEDLRVTCPRCVYGRLVPAGGELVVVGDTKGVKLKEDPKFAVGKFGGRCDVKLTR